MTQSYWNRRDRTRWQREFERAFHDYRQMTRSEDLAIELAERDANRLCNINEGPDEQPAKQAP
jgi:hypothetical protein